MEKAVSWKKILILAIAVCLFAGIIVKCNQFQKTPLASYKGQKYEKAVVTKIIKDNLAEDGSRYGTQKVLVKMTTGTYKGKEKQAINPSGTLFGADCKVGARIIVIVNKSGTNAGFTVYSQDRTMAIYGFALISRRGRWPSSPKADPAPLRGRAEATSCRCPAAPRRTGARAPRVPA